MSLQVMKLNLLEASQACLKKSLVRHVLLTHLDLNQSPNSTRALPVLLLTFEVESNLSSKKADTQFRGACMYVCTLNVFAPC